MPKKRKILITEFVIQVSSTGITWNGFDKFMWWLLTRKREILAALGTSWTLKDGKLDVLIYEPLRHIGNCAKMVRTLQETAKSRFEPEKNETHRRETSGSAYECLNILPEPE